MKVMRNFSVEVSEPQVADGDYTKGKYYPVLALDKVITVGSTGKIGQPLESLKLIKEKKRGS